MSTAPTTPDIFSQLAAQQNPPSQQLPAQQSLRGQASASPQLSQRQGAGDVFDQLANGTGATASPNATPNTDDSQPGLLERLYETSGAKGLVELGKQAVNRPIDLYHQGVEAAQAGDWKTASEKASMIVTAGITDKHNPIYKAAEAIIMNPIDEVKAAYREDKKAGGSVNSLMNSYRTLKGRIHEDAAGGNYAGVAGDLAGTLDSHAMGVIPLLGPAIRQEGGNLDEDLHAENYRAVAGDILGPLLTFGVGKAIGGLGDTAEAVTAARPITEEIAGERVPVASGNPQLPSQVRASRVLSAAASPEGAANFVAEQVQPAAVKATQSNFVRSALGAVDRLRKIRGADPLSAAPPALNSIDDIARLLQNEASTTYNALDDSAQTDLDAWDKQYGYAGRKPLLFDANDEPITSPPPPPRPKLFTELQDQINDARSTLRSRVSSQVDKAAAKESLPGYQREMSELLAKHKDSVSAGELDAANGVYTQAQRYKWIANKIRPALKGTANGNVFQAETPSINATTLRSMPALFDNRYGDGAFARLLGPDGIRNYNDVTSALVTPATGGTLADWVGKLPFHTGELAKMPLSVVADKLLFDPKAGQTAITLWRQAMRGTGSAVQASPVSPAAEPDDQ